MNIRAARAGLRIHEVPSFEYDRRHGTNNLRARRDGMRVLRTIFVFQCAPMDGAEDFAWWNVPIAWFSERGVFFRPA